MFKNLIGRTVVLNPSSSDPVQGVVASVGWRWLELGDVVTRIPGASGPTSVAGRLRIRRAAIATMQVL